MVRRNLSLLMTVACGIASQLSFDANAAVLFRDGFESGDRSHLENGVRWTDAVSGTRPTTARAKTGAWALEFRYLAATHFQEQRISFGAPYKELWIKYDLYVPANYVQYPGDQGSNNKFFAIFSNSNSFYCNFSTYPDGNGGSNIGIHYFNNGAERPYLLRQDALWRAADLGKWHRIVLHFKAASTTSAADGQQEVWKDGALVLSNTSLANGGTAGGNHIEAAYFLGWANTGYSQETVFYIDDVEISTTPIPPSEGQTPKPPEDVVAQ